MASNAAGRRRPVSWEKDGVDGGPCSVDVILDWITKEGNLQRWRGDTVGGKTKKALATEIVGLIREAGIAGRTYKDILQKINDIQDSYNKAADLKRQSGEGLLDADDAKRFFHEKLVSICKHWDVLYPVFHNRAPVKSIAPTGTIKPLQSSRDPVQRGGLQRSELDKGDDDFDFPFGNHEYPKSDDGDTDDANADHAVGSKEYQLASTTVTVTAETDKAAPIASIQGRCAPAGIDIGIDTSSEEAATHSANVASSRAENAEHASSGNKKHHGKSDGSNSSKSERSKPLTLSSKPTKKRKSLEDVMYDSICDRTTLAQRRSCIEPAHAKVQFTRDLMDLGTYSTDEVKATVAAQFEDK